MSSLEISVPREHRLILSQMLTRQIILQVCYIPQSCLYSSFLRIWSHLLNKSLMENFIFLSSVACFILGFSFYFQNLFLCFMKIHPCVST